jgi:hypothetical protein
MAEDRDFTGGNGRELEPAIGVGADPVPSTGAPERKSRTRPVTVPEPVVLRVTCEVLPAMTSTRALAASVPVRASRR